MAVEGATLRGLVSMAAIFAIMVICISPAGALKVSAGAPRGTNTEFVRQSCSSTLFPSLCYASLAPFANNVNRDPIRLAGVATNVSLTNIRAVASHISSVLYGPSAQKMDRRMAPALRDCEETLQTASSLTEKAAAELRRLSSAQGMEIAELVGNAQTRMSATLTNENTCVDELASAGSSAVKAGVVGRVQKAAQSSSNALALVNLLVGANN